MSGARINTGLLRLVKKSLDIFFFQLLSVLAVVVIILVHFGYIIIFNLSKRFRGSDWWSTFLTRRSQLLLPVEDALEVLLLRLGRRFCRQVRQIKNGSQVKALPQREMSTIR